MSAMHDLDGYLTKRAMDIDDALASGEYQHWPEIQVEIPVELLGVLRFLADRRGVQPTDLIAAIAHQGARETLKELLWE